jgi:maleylacetoacetate isomerase
MKLYSYFRSSAAYRVRIALNLKQLPYDMVPIHLLKNGGEQFSATYTGINPQKLVPALVDESMHSNTALTQSLAIIEYLDEVYPEPPLLPASALDKAYVRSIALSVACEIHPLNNLRVLNYLVHDLKVSHESKDAWYRHWCEHGLAAIETTLARDDRVGQFCFGDAPSMADCLLVPQVANAIRVNCDLTAMPTILRINTACLALDAFARAAPENQPDAA